MKVLILLASLVLAANGLVRPKNDLTCNICMDIMTSDTTEQEIVDFIKQICHSLGQLIPNFEDTCNFIVQSQLPAIIDAFVHDNLDPSQVCTQVFGACP